MYIPAIFLWAALVVLTVKWVINHSLKNTKQTTHIPPKDAA